LTPTNGKVIDSGLWHYTAKSREIKAKSELLKGKF